MTDKERYYAVPEAELHELYSTLADATQAAATGDPNGCAKLAAEAKRQVRDIHHKYDETEQ